MQNNNIIGGCRNGSALKKHSLALAEDPHSVTHSPSVTPVPGALLPPLPSVVNICMLCTGIHIGKTLTHMQFFNSKK